MSEYKDREVYRNEKVNGKDVLMKDVWKNGVARVFAREYGADKEWVEIREGCNYDEVNYRLKHTNMDYDITSDILERKIENLEKKLLEKLENMSCKIEEVEKKIWRPQLTGETGERWGTITNLRKYNKKTKTWSSTNMA